MSRTFLSRWLLPALLLVGLVHGLIYVFVVPPWEHYDEPGHMEYLLLAAQEPRAYRYGETDPAIRQAIFESMTRHGFFARRDAVPDPSDPFLGPLQTGDRPLYYVLAGLPQRLLPASSSIETRLIVARLFSLALLLGTLFTAWKILGALLGPGHPLRGLTMLALALLPGFVDQMTAVNNGALAVLAFHLFLCAGVVLVRQGWSLPRILAVTGSAALCALTKNQVLLAVPLALVALLLALRGQRALRWVGLALAALGVLAAALALRWDDNLYWTRRSYQPGSTHVAGPDAPNGAHYLALTVRSGYGTNGVYQLLPPAAWPELRVGEVTVGAWIWASEPTTVMTPMLRGAVYGGEGYGLALPVQVGMEPRFFAFRMPAPAAADWMYLVINPKAPRPDPVNVFYDGVVVVTGALPTDQTPVFDDASLRSGTWGGQRFVNLARNPSFEQAGPGVRARVEQLSYPALMVYHWPSILVGNLIDLPGLGWYWRWNLNDLVRSFFARFGWGEVLLMGRRPYLALGIVLAALLLSAAALVWQRRGSWRGARLRALLFLALSSLALWIFVFLRGWMNYPDSMITANARYAYPAALPVVLVYSAGAWFLARRWGGRGVWAAGAVFGSLAAWGIYSILSAPFW